MSNETNVRVSAGESAKAGCFGALGVMSAPVLLVIGGIAVMCILCSICSFTGMLTAPPSSTVNSNTEEKDNPLLDDLRIGTEFTIDTTKLEGTMGGKANLWASFEDRSSVLGQLSHGDKVTLTQFDKTNNYCEVKSATVKGWLSCELVANFEAKLTELSNLVVLDINKYINKSTSELSSLKSAGKDGLGNPKYESTTANYNIFVETYNGKSNYVQVQIKPLNCTQGVSGSKFDQALSAVGIDKSQATLDQDGKIRRYFYKTWDLSVECSGLDKVMMVTLITDYPQV